MAVFTRLSGASSQKAEHSRLALEAALKVSEIASSPTSLPSAVEQMLRAAIGLLKAEQGSIMLLDESGKELVLVASHGLPPEIALGYRLKVGHSVAGRVIASGSALRLGDVPDDQFINFVPKSRAIGSSLVVPLRVQGRCIGVLNLAKDKSTNEFTDEDMRVAQMFADQAAGLVHRTRLHEQAEQRSSDLMALVESSKGLLGTLDMDVLLQRILDGGTRLTGCKKGFACLFEAEDGALARGVFRGLERGQVRSIVERPETQKAVKALTAIGFEDPELGTYVAVGLSTTQGTRGVLVVEAERAVAEQRDEVLRAFGQQCSTALGAAELHSVVQRKESELSSIILGVPNPMVLVDAARRIVAMNPAAETVFGVNAIFVTGHAAAGRIGHEEIERLLIGDGDLQTEVELGSPPRTYKARVLDVRVPGAPTGRVLIMDDVTTEREIVQTQHDFVAMIGHELRTPLTIVKGFARTLLMRVDKASREEAVEALETIDTRTAQLEHLIEDLLYVSKIESREASLRVELTGMPEVFDRVAREVLEDHPGREVTLEVRPDLEWACDDTKVSLVLRHLIDNALKFSSEPDAVVVRAIEEDDGLRIDIIDKGVGIISSDIPHIFDRFRQVDTSSTREHGGTGVGLYLCAQLVHVHGGRIWVDSTWGKGSTFSFTLPRRKPRSEVTHLSSDKKKRTA
jgi:signal transduction histidine kinase/putative methionine-R-sulfoxide reductase with GAF domain